MSFLQQALGSNPPKARKPGKRKPLKKKPKRQAIPSAYGQEMPIQGQGY